MCRKLTAVLLFASAIAALAGGKLFAQASSAEPSAQPAPGKGRLEPVFPQKNDTLVFVEGEDAVSTNFSREPVLSYSCSGSRTLQLNSAAGLAGVGTFYADYAFTVPSAGVYELWYGGTPPGPREDLYPSYSSPFQITLDSGRPIPVYRETVTVAGNYAPAYYWNLVGDLTLDAKAHSLRFGISDKRRIDGRYFFYLDCFFLVRKDNGKRVLTPPLPAVFPKDLDDKSINAPFLSIDDYLIRIRDNPGSIQPYVYISQIYTMLGDYLNALKYLNRAAPIQPGNPEVLLLTAKNRIWKGDVTEGLAKYRELLSKDPNRHDLWMEAGKVAAWTGRYDDSVSFFREGLAAFPRDLDLTVNLGLTYLWAGRGSEAESELREAQNIAGTDSGLLKQLGRVYRVNGYPDRAAADFALAIRVSPQDLEAYLLLIDAYLFLGRTADSEKVEAQISDTFFPSPTLSAYLDSFKAQEGMKDRVIADYRAKLADHPDNLALRQLLAQTYFWNGKKKEAIEEYRRILVIHAHLALKDMEVRSAGLLQAMDESSLAVSFLGRLPADAEKARAALTAQLSRSKTVMAAGDQAGMEGEAASLNQRIEEARALIGGLQLVVDLAAAHKDRIAALQASDDKDRQVFADLTRSNKWTWDRQGETAELRAGLSADVLARLVLAKIYLADRQWAGAQALLAAASGESAAGIGLDYAKAQCLLWGGRAQEALPIIASLAAVPGAAVPAYFPDFARLALHLSAPASAPSSPTEGGEGAADPAAEGQALAVELAGLEKVASETRTALQKELAVLSGMYSGAVMRAFYSLDEDTYGLRNELGDYYVGEEQLAPAIAQFRRVLAIDPGNVSAQFRLGKIYQWSRDWHSALDAYRGVYAVDPYFENVAALFNQVSRDHADTLASTGSYFADTTRSQLHAEASYTRLFDSVWGLTVAYRADDWRVNRVANGLVDHSAYSVQDVGIGAPMDLYFLNLKLTPWLGGYLTGNGLFYRADTLGAPQNPGDLFEAYSASLYAQADLSLGVPNVLFLTSSVRWGRYPETFDPLRTPINDASAELNLSLPLSFIDAFLLRDTTLRTYGKVDYLVDGSFGFNNAIATAAEEITVTLVKGGSPYSLLALIANVTYQDCARNEPYLYYSPVSELTAGGSLMGSTWIGIGGGAVLGASLRGFAGTYQQQLTSPSPISFLKFEGEATASLTQGTSAYTLDAVYDIAVPTVAGPATYWSLVVRLGYSMKLPEILAP